MAKCDASFPIPLPDDPKKWDGWNNYKSPNYYERLCLDPQANPSNQLIEEHCRELLRWWQKKLPLKNQPSNPIAQMLRSGLDESSRYLTEARVELLDPERRCKLDEQLVAQQQEEAIVEFQKYFVFATSHGFLSPQEEQNLIHFGAGRGLSSQQMNSLIEEALKENGVQRAQPVLVPQPAPVKSSNGKQPANPQEEFHRLLRLSGLDSDTMTDDQRDALINMAENLGVEAGEAEDMVDAYLEEADEKAFSAVGDVSARVEVVASAPRPVVEEKLPPKIEINPDLERTRYANFTCSLGFEMLFIPSGEFAMGSEDADAAPNERPVTKIGVSHYYLSRYLITNSDYEKFDPSHAQKRMPGAGERHPVVHVSSADAMKFCHWLSARERRKYRLPTEAEWEYAARGTDGRRYPWGNYDRRGDLSNFADKNTVFAWSDRELDDGYAETSPVGAFPMGASPSGIEDMAGNVWEWCIDYYAPYNGAPRVNPRGPATGARRVYRGGSWKSRFNSLRATARGSNAPNYSCNDLGFRVACECE
ncbi:MAG: formylglycine-generating enzyme family protein [Verrucomicrobiota bacterium]